MVMVTKRAGYSEELDLNKIHRVLEWASDGLDVSVSEVELASGLHFVDGMKTQDIHQVLINSAEGLANDRQPDYLKVAARLGFFDIRKRAYGGFTPPSLAEHIERLVDLGRYAIDLSSYTAEDLATLDAYIDHELDLTYPFSAYREFVAKYLVRDRITDQLYESPQMAFMCQAMMMFVNERPEERVGYVCEYYQRTSQLSISQPTPVMAGVRTPSKQYSSCVKIDVGDSIESIAEASAATYRYIARKAGIGFNIGENRGVKSSVRGGDATNTGVVEFIRAFQQIVNSTNQGNLRKGSATVYFPWFHIEFERLIELKNSRGTEETSARHLDYGVQLNDFLYARAARKQEIRLYSPRDVPGLYDAFFANPQRFQELYEYYEQDDSIRHIKMNADALFGKIMQERLNTGRIYIMNIDNVNQQGPFKPEVAPIRMSNLCIEIAIPTVTLAEHPLGDRDSGEIALCTLQALNLGDPNFDVYSERGLLWIEETLYWGLRGLDNLLTDQEYPTAASRRNTERWRPVGVGVINMAYYLAKNGVRYTDGSANQLVHDTFEAISYYLYKASCRLSAERGSFLGWDDTRYADGLLNIDTYNRNVDELVPNGSRLRLDWTALRAMIKQDRLRHAVQMAQMPCETSSRISGGTNGFDPPRADISVKTNNDFSVKVAVPEFERLKDQYEFVWDMRDNFGYLTLAAIAQKFVTQMGSFNTWHNPDHHPGRKIPTDLVAREIYFARKYGIKSLYYDNTKDGQKDTHTRPARESRRVEPLPTMQMVDDGAGGCDSGACAI